MWFIFPQIAGLGFSAMAQRFRNRLAHRGRRLPGARCARTLALLECTRLVLAASEKTITEILGSPDDMKFRSCMTLFDAVSKQEIFAEAIAAFYPDGKDRATLEILGNKPTPIVIAARRQGTRPQLYLFFQTRPKRTD